MHRAVFAGRIAAPPRGATRIIPREDGRPPTAERKSPLDGARPQQTSTNVPSKVRVRTQVALLADLWAAALPKPPRGRCPAPGAAPLGDAVSLFVAVPSAVGNAARRRAVRETWCARAAAAALYSAKVSSATVAFFVGEASGPGSETTEAALRDENATNGGDVVQVPGLVDAATNVTAKLLYSLRYFERGARARRAGTTPVFEYRSSVVSRDRRGPPPAGGRTT